MCKLVKTLDSAPLSLSSYYLALTMCLYPAEPVDAQIIQFQSEDEKLRGATQSACNTRSVSQQDEPRQCSQQIPAPYDDTTVYPS